MNYDQPTTFNRTKRDYRAGLQAQTYHARGSGDCYRITGICRNTYKN